ncbi:MAG: M3 family oligoendopeptidase [Oscillospiraceae bacterium]|jgi:M3 family oligoendopeptidase|nr:M3 family oligoendopeptidase [Oscillospiraceae bacterium]
MKFQDMPYTRPDLEQIKKDSAAVLERMESAASAAEQLAAYMDYEEQKKVVDTACTLAYVRHTINTKDAFYEKENDFADEIGPALQELSQKIDLALLRSKFRPELEEKLGKLLFTNLEISVRTMKPEIMDLMQEENRLQSEYQKLYASALVEWEGEYLPLPRLGPYKQSPDRAVRRAAFAAEGGWFDRHQEELDRLYDKLVKNRTAQGRAMGYENYLPLGYDRLGRNCWGPAEAAAFRDQIASDLVPIVAKVKGDQERRLGVDKLKFYDDLLLFPDGNADPRGTAEDILAAGREMYRQLSPETAEFVDFLYDGELLDVLSKEGKAPGGYCTGLPLYKAPFIFSNFNGTSGDVDVLTHEAGHAFADYRAMRRDCLSALRSPTMEGCETHSMSMEFLTAPWHEKFFGDRTRKYEIGHCEESLIFIPYGCMVDEFQHRMYENPELTPAQRNAVWLELEGKYRPWIDFEDLPFYSRGAGWQRQLHIYLYPFYYIDYCMAQTVAFQFWLASMADRQDAWARYLRFVDAGGTATFRDLVASAGLRLPYAPGAIREIGEAISGWIEANPL